MIRSEDKKQGSRYTEEGNLNKEETCNQWKDFKFLIKRGEKEPLFSRVFFEAVIKHSEELAW